MRISRVRMVVMGFAATLLLHAEEPAAAGCRVTEVSPVGFGAYDPTSATPVDTTGEFAVQCDVETPVRISLGRGLSGRQIPRELRYRGRALAYNLFLNAARTAVWGDGSGGTQVFQGVVPRRGELRIPIYARLAPRQQVPPGVYRDRISIFVVF